MILGYSSNFDTYVAEGSGTDMACFDKIGNTYPSVTNKSVDSNGFGYHAEIGTVGERSFYTSRTKLVDRTFSWFTQGYDEGTKSYLGVADKQYNALNYTYYWIAIG